MTTPVTAHDAVDDQSPDALLHTLVTASSGTESTLPSHVREVFTHLADLLDADLAMRTTPTMMQLSRQHLNAGDSQLSAAKETLNYLSFTVAGVALAGLIEAYPDCSIGGLEPDQPPEWRRVRTLAGEGPDVYVSVPRSLHVFFPAGTACEVGIVVVVDEDYSGFELCVLSTQDDARHAKRWLTQLIDAGLSGGNFYRGKTLLVSRDNALTIDIVEDSTTSRDDIVLPSGVWDAIDVNVFGLFDRRDMLAAAGLGTNRGLLLAGPPGTGKTALCKYLAAELVGRATIIFADAKVVGSSLATLYAQLAHLGPCLVIMEDLDLIIGSRQERFSPNSLNEFLATLDGVMNGPQDVVTVATTNDVKSIDPAARRAARFDALIEVGAPDVEARTKMLAHYLRKVSADIDVPYIAGLTDGASGADLRELIRLGVLTHGEHLSTHTLTELAQGGRWRTRPAVGQYL